MTAAHFRPAVPPWAVGASCGRSPGRWESSSRRRRSRRGRRRRCRGRRRGRRGRSRRGRSRRSRRGSRKRRKNCRKGKEEELQEWKEEKQQKEEGKGKREASRTGAGAGEEIIAGAWRVGGEIKIKGEGKKWIGKFGGVVHSCDLNSQQD